MTATKDTLQVTRVIKAARQEVFDAWTRIDLLEKWFAPRECDVLTVEADPRVGGSYRGSMNCDGADYTAFGTYREVIPNRKLVFTHQWEEPNPVETLVTVEFEDKDGGTEVTFTQEGFIYPEQVKSHEEGWTSALENLAGLFS